MKKIYVIFLFVLLSASLIFASGSKEEAKVEVVGRSVVKAKADTVTFKLSVEDIKSTSLSAQNSVNKATNNLINKLEKLSITKNQISTDTIALGEYKEWENDKYVVKGQRARQRLSITIGFNQDLISKIVEIIANDDLITIRDTQYSLNDNDALKKEARIKAIEDAKAKAQDYANGCNKKVNSVYLITENTSYDYDMYNSSRVYGDKAMEMSAEADSIEPTLIYPTDITVTQEVKVIFTLK